MFLHSFRDGRRRRDKPNPEYHAECTVKKAHRAFHGRADAERQLATDPRIARTSKRAAGPFLNPKSAFCPSYSPFESCRNGKHRRSRFVWPYRYHSYGASDGERSGRQRYNNGFVCFCLEVLSWRQNAARVFEPWSANERRKVLSILKHNSRNVGTC